MKIKSVFKTTLLSCTLILSLAFNVGAQCAMCKSSVESNQKEQVLLARKKALGLNNGILYMMVIPYILFSVIGIMWYRNSKRERQERLRINSITSKSDL